MVSLPSLWLAAVRKPRIHWTPPEDIDGAAGTKRNHEELALGGGAGSLQVDPLRCLYLAALAGADLSLNDGWYTYVRDR